MIFLRILLLVSCCSAFVAAEERQTESLRHGGRRLLQVNHGSSQRTRSPSVQPLNIQLTSTALSHPNLPTAKPPSLSSPPPRRSTSPPPRPPKAPSPQPRPPKPLSPPPRPPKPLSPPPRPPKPLSPPPRSPRPTPPKPNKSPKPPKASPSPRPPAPKPPSRAPLPPAPPGPKPPSPKPSPLHAPKPPSPRPSPLPAPKPPSPRPPPTFSQQPASPSSVTTQTSTNGGGCIDAKDALDATNTYRMMHGAQPVVWSEPMAKSSQEWAANLAKNDCSLDHSPDYNYGENILSASGYPKPAATCADAVSAWYSEVDYYNFTSRPFTDNAGSKVGHFTQLVWNATTAVGCGVAVVEQLIQFPRSVRVGGCRVVVCRYLPPGNYAGDNYFLKNVFKPLP